MKLNNHNPKELLKQWGKHREVLPTGNDRLKQQMLESLPRETHAVAKRPTRLIWVGSGMLCTVLLFMAVSKFVLGNLSSATSSGSAYEYETVRRPSLDSNGLMYEGPAGLGGGGGGSAQALGIRATESGLSGNRGPGFIGKAINSLTSGIDDTREYLKTGYNTKIKTRKVSKIATSLQTIIRGHGGRIDSASVNTKSAYIYFVLPKSAFEQFKMELKDLVPERFLEESITMENRLPQKQYIETDIKSNEDWMISLQQSRQALIADHDSKVAEKQKQINNYNYRISLLNKEITTNTERLAQIDKDKAWLNSEVRYQKQLLDNENYQFKKSLQNIDYNISNAGTIRTDLQKQDTNLIKDVETVNGYISLQWISIFELLDLYVPIYWIMSGTVVLLIVYLLFGRRVRFDESLIQ